MDWYEDVGLNLCIVLADDGYREKPFVKSLPQWWFGSVPILYEYVWVVHLFGAA